MGTLIGEARRRILNNELLAQGANAFSAALAAFILLLLLGSEILSWPVALCIPVAAMAIGFYRARRRLPARYVVAQLVDRRLNLSDALSTAVFFHEVAPDAPVDRVLKRAQFEHAESVARAVDLRQAIPLVMPRSAYLMAALLLVASSLFMLRYGLSRRLDLKQPLASFLPQSPAPGKRTEHARNQHRNPKQFPQAPQEAGEDPDGSQQRNRQGPNQQIRTAGEPESEAAPNSNSNAQSPGKKQNEQPGSQTATTEQEQGDDKDAGNSEDHHEGQQGGNRNSPQQNQQAGNKQDAANNAENSSLMDKMKDAFQNLMSKVKPQQPQPQNGAPQQDQNGRQGKGQQASRQQDSKDGRQPKAGQQGEPQEGNNGEQAKNDPNSQQQKGQGKSDSQQAARQPGSGVGSQDGEKAIRNAEQLAAMGKLTELMGKRSQNITGEATVEVQSTNQQLRTNYSSRSAQHTQGGAEIRRDEVPVALQPYVQQYFEQIRKQRK